MEIVEDSEIMQRLQDDDESALAIVLRQVVPSVWPLLVRKFRESLTDEDLEEVVASSLAKLWHKRKTFDLDKGDLRGWFYVILKNSALDMIRRRSPKVVEVLSVEPINLDIEVSEQEMEVVLKSALQQLNQREQHVLVPLFEGSGLSATELGETLSISAGAVRQLRFRAIQKLQTRLQQVGYTIHRVKTRQPSNRFAR